MKSNVKRQMIKALLVAAVVGGMVGLMNQAPTAQTQDAFDDWLWRMKYDGQVRALQGIERQLGWMRFDSQRREMEAAMPNGREQMRQSFQDLGASIQGMRQGQLEREEHEMRMRLMQAQIEAFQGQPRELQQQTYQPIPVEAPRREELEWMRQPAPIKSNWLEYDPKSLPGDVLVSRVDGILFHRPECPLIASANGLNLQISDDRKEVLALGFRACKICNP